MTFRRSATLLAGFAAIALAAVVLAGCGGGTSSATGALPKTTSGRPATIGVASNSLGDILVNSQGRTLYLFAKDTGSTSTCSGACAVNWPPLRANGEPAIGSGVTRSLVGVSKRPDGVSQVTYNGHPVYLFKADTSAGQTGGEAINAFGAAWYVLSAAGSAITTTARSVGGGY
jgi:predicted lipoprotein with Yx(FWY)xxD motif